MTEPNQPTKTLFPLELDPFYTDFQLVKVCGTNMCARRIRILIGALNCMFEPCITPDLSEVTYLYRVAQKSKPLYQVLSLNRIKNRH